MRRILMKSARVLFSAAILAGAAACGDGGDGGTGPQQFSAAGTWQGTSGNVTLRVTLTQNGQQISGNGTISGGSSLAVTAMGTNVSNNVALTMQASGFQDLNFTGTLSSASTMSGSLNGSGFNNFAITLLRQ